MKQRTFFIIGAVLILGAVFAAVAMAQSTGTGKSKSSTTECTPEMMENMKGNMTEACTTEMMEHMDDESRATGSNHCGGEASMMGAGMMGKSKGTMM